MNVHRNSNSSLGFQKQTLFLCSFSSWGPKKQLVGSIKSLTVVTLRPPVEKQRPPPFRFPPPSLHPSLPRDAIRTWKGQGSASRDTHTHTHQMSHTSTCSHKAPADTKQSSLPCCILTDQLKSPHLKLRRVQ